MHTTLRSVFFTQLYNRYAPILLIFIVLSLLSCPVQGQFFVADGTPCPHGTDVSLDTLTFSADKAMPFDRCFYLKVTLPSPQRITGFSITPIDKDGNPKARRRDLRVLLRSGYTAGKSRCKARKNTNFKSFKHDKIKREFTGVFPKTKTKQITLHVPPLDPGREYRIILLGDDNAASDDYVTVGDLIVQSKGQFGLTTPTAVEAAELMNQAEIGQNRSNTDQNKRDIAFYRPNINTHISYLTSFSLVFNQNSKNPAIRYRLFFVPTGTTLSDPVAAKDIRDYIQAFPKSFPDTVAVRLPINDITGKQRFSFENWQASILLLYESDTISAGPASLDLIRLGDLEFKENGLTRIFTVNDRLPGSKLIKLVEGPLGQFSKIKKALDVINKPPAILSESTNDSTLRFLLEQASLCPCKEKGIKDLTQKDDLMRVISLLYDNKGGIVTNLLQGLISLKDPSADPVEPEKYALRAANLTVSLNQINDLIDFARKEKSYYSRQEGRITILLSSLETLRDGLTAEINALTDITTAQAELKAGYIDQFMLIKAIPIGLGSTTQLDLVSEARLRIVPDFGFVALFKGNNTLNFQDFTPYLGFQIGFRPMDKNIPLRLIRYKSWRHRLSFMSGITLKPLKVENQRDDFFGNNSLITGLGFRLNNYLRITSGAVWFKATDPNPLTNNKPLRFSPFLGLSLDLDIQDLFGGIKKLFL